MALSYPYKTLNSIMDSYPYFALQQKLENTDESLKKVVQNYIQLVIDMHAAQNNDIIKSNTTYALRLRESEIKNKQLQAENIEQRMTVAQLRAKVEKLRHQRAKTNDSFKENVKSASDKIISLVQQLQGATDSLSTLVDPESARGSSFISDGSSILGSSIDLTNGSLCVTSGIQYSELMTDMDIATEMVPHKKKPVNLLAVYRKQPKALVQINESTEEQEDPESSTSAPSSCRSERVEESEITEIFQRDRQQNDNEPSSKRKLRRIESNHDLLPASSLRTLFAKKKSSKNQTLDKSEIQQQHAEKEYLSAFQPGQESKSNCTYETRENVEQHTFPSVSNSTFQRAVASTLSPMTIHNENSVVDSQRSSQNVDKCNKKNIKDEPESVMGVNERESRGRKRSQVNYVEPNLRSKLRKGDPHTYTLDSRNF